MGRGFDPGMHFPTGYDRGEKLKVDSSLSWGRYVTLYIPYTNNNVLL